MLLRSWRMPSSEAKTSPVVLYRLSGGREGGASTQDTYHMIDAGGRWYDNHRWSLGRLQAQPKWEMSVQSAPPRGGDSCSAQMVPGA